MSNNSKGEQNKTGKESDPNVFDEFVGYLGKGNTDKIMRELRGDVEPDIDKT